MSACLASQSGLSVRSGFKFSNRESIITSSEICWPELGNDWIPGRVGRLVGVFETGVLVSLMEIGAQPASNPRMTKDLKSPFCFSFQNCFFLLQLTQDQARTLETK